MSGQDDTERKADEPFLARWARVKHDRAQAAALPVTVGAPENAELANTSVGGHLQPKIAEEAHAEPGLPNSSEPVALPSLDSLTPQSDYSPFMARNVDTQLRNQAMKKLFTDPHYNVMDGLDTYIDDYSIERPLSIDIIRQMNISKTLGLFEDEEKLTEPVAGAVEVVAPPQDQAVMPQVDAEGIVPALVAGKSEDECKNEPPTPAPD